MTIFGNRRNYYRISLALPIFTGIINSVRPKRSQHEREMMTTTIYDAKRMEIVTTGGTITSLDMLSRDDGLFLAGFCYVRGWRPSGPAGDEWQRSALQTIPEGWVAIDEKQSSGNRTMFTVKAKVLNADQSPVQMSPAVRAAAIHWTKRGGGTAELLAILEAAAV